MFRRAMSTLQNGTSKPLKILMLHGYTQSGPLFSAKTKALEKILKKSFPGVILSYPTGPMRLKPHDIPGFSSDKYDGVDGDADQEVEAYGWWRRSNTAEPPEYVGLEEGLKVVSDVLSAEGPFDGVMGFSQGGCMAAMVASLLEGESRRKAFEVAQGKSKVAVAFPEPFEGLKHPPLRFAVSYSGFVAPGERYGAFYEPKITTPVCHFVGSLDTVVSEERTDALVDATGGSGQEKAMVVVHPGGHFVPAGRQYLDAVVGFMRAKMEGHREDGEKEERAEDMDVPF